MAGSGRRAWNRLRVYVDEQTVRRRYDNTTTINWTLIRRTINAMSQPYQSRDVLYQRYLYHPDNWLSGFINCPTQLVAQRRTDAADASTTKPNSDVRQSAVNNE